MAETVDSLSIELTASTESAESSIDRLIGKLNQLKGAVAGASNFSRFAKGIAEIAEAAKGLDTEAGRKLARLAGGLDALSKVRNLDNLKGAGKNLASVMKAVNGMGQTGGKGMSGLADGIKQTSDALGGIKDSDVSKLGAIRDTLAGEVSGPLHTSDRVSESAALGGMGAPEPSFGNMATYGAMTMFKYTADSIRDATAAYREFQAALGGGMPPIFTDFADSAAQAGESVRMLTGSVGGGQEGPFEADEIRDAARAYDDLGGSASRAADVIETEFADTERAASGLAGLRDTLGGIGGYIANDVKNVFSNTLKAIGGFGRSVLRIARYRLIRSMIRTITEGFTEGKKNLYEWSRAMDGHFAASMDRLATSTQYLKNSLGTLVGPLMEALEPALTWIIDRLVDFINTFNMFVAVISGRSTYTAAVRAATTWGGAVSNAAGNASNAVSNAVDDMKRTIMGFDEINKLNEVADSGSGSDSSGSGGGSGSGAGLMFEEKPISNSFVQDFGKALETALQDSLSRITLIVGAAELAVGAILALSGANMPLGLALIATGAVTMGSAIFANWDGIPDEIKLVVGAIEAALGGGLAVGAVLAFSTGHIGLGIGLMVAALSTEFSAVTVVWTTLKDKIGGQIQAIGVLLGGATFGLGAVLAFAGHPSLGIAMMIAGASVAAVSINWNYIKDKLEGPIGAAVGIFTGTALIVLGILAILGSNIPLGIGLIIAGAGSLASVVAANWDNLTAFFEDLWTKFKTAAENTWEALKEIGAGIWEKIKEGVTGAVAGVGGWIKEHIFKPFVDAWHWLLGLFGGGGDDSGLSSNAAQVAANAAYGSVANASVADDIAEGTTDKESIQKLKEIGATMGDAIKDGMNDRLKNISGEIWNTIITGWNSETRELPVSVKFGTNGGIDTPENVEIPVKLKKDGWTSLANFVGTHTASVGIAISTKAMDLWSEFKSAWEAAKTSLYASCKLDNTGAVLWNNIKSEWDAAGSKSLYLSPKLDNSADVLYNGFKSEWDALGSKALYFSPKLDNGASVLYEAFKKDWDGSGSKTLYFSPKLDNTAQTIYNAFKKEWDSAGSTTLYLSPKLDNTGTVLWNGFKGEWDAAKSTLYASPKLDNTAAVLWAAFKKEWDSAAETLKIKVELDYSGTDGFGGATGGGGSNSGSGAGRSIKVAVEPETTVGGKTFWERAKEAIDAAGGAVDKGLDVIVRPALNSAGEKITSIVKWLFGNDNTPDVTTKVNASAGAGFSGLTGNTFTLGGITGSSVTVNGTPGAGFTGQLSGTNKYTLAGIEDASAKINGTLAPTNTASDAFDTSSVLGFQGTLSRQNKDNDSPKSVFNSGTVIGFLGTLSRQNKDDDSPKTVFNAATVMGFLGTLSRQNKDNDSPNSVFNSGTVLQFLGKLKRKDKNQKPSKVFSDGKTFSYKGTLKAGWKDPIKALGLNNLKTKVKVNLEKGDKDTVIIKPANNQGEVKMEVKRLGGVFSNGLWKSISQFANGGIFTNGLWKSIPQYAGGTTNAHGSMFLAGEAGPELVGHVGGRTEVLNQSQLAATMFSAVRAAMGGVKIAATMYDGGDDNSEADYETMYRAMYDAFTDAMAGSNERDREKVQLMRQIAAKEFTAEVTAASVNRAQTRMNRRAGTTIVPVGT